MTTSHRPPLPQHTLGTTSIPTAFRPVALTSDRDLIDRVLTGLTAMVTDPLDAGNHCPDSQLEEEQQPVHTSTGATNPDEEVIRILAPADSGNPAADAWNIVTLTRPRGSTEPVWKPFAAYGPMTWDKANEFLTALGVQAISFGNRSDFPILDSLPRHSAEVTLDTEEGIPLPRTAALIQQLTSEHGPEYTGILARAVEDANHGDQGRYLAGLNAAIDVLAANGDRPKWKALAINHVGLFLNEIRADTYAASHYGAMPRTPTPADGRSGEVR
jgi:hypothetical protein